MNISNSEAEISFRFLDLDKFQAYSLVREIVDFSYEEQIESQRYIAKVPLTQQNFEEINDYYVRQRIEVQACDIFVSANSTSNIGVVEIPAIVNRMLKYIDCKLTFYFTLV